MDHGTTAVPYPMNAKGQIPSIETVTGMKESMSIAEKHNAAGWKPGVTHSLIAVT